MSAVTTTRYEKTGNGLIDIIISEKTPNNTRLNKKGFVPWETIGFL